MVQNGKVVDITYTLKNSKGEELDRADATDPFAYLHGASQIVPGLEGALEGLKVGDKKNVVVQARDGYGEIIPELKMTVNRSLFPAGKAVQPGMQFAANVGDGRTMPFRVESVEGENVVIDGNHPLAGQTLHFDVEIVNVRDATEDELEHGHAHTPGSHHDH